MKYAYIIGGSGSGKTTLSINLGNWDPDYFYRVIERTTREPREGETLDFDYHFITPEKWVQNDVEGEWFEKVKYQFGNKRYGCTWGDLDENRWNLIVASIEAIITGLGNTNEEDETYVINIEIDTDIDVLREGRDYSFEENYNKSVLEAMFNTNFSKFFNDLNVKFINVPLSKLKSFRGENEKELTVEYFKNLIK